LNGAGEGKFSFISNKKDHGNRQKREVLGIRKKKAMRLPSWVKKRERIMIEKTEKFKKPSLARGGN